MNRAVGAASAVPRGYTQVTVRDATVVARQDAVEGITAALRDTRTLHAWAATQPGARRFQGRDAAWGVRLPHSALHVVVRHARHGGWLAPITGDRYRWPGRAPLELAIVLQLQQRGVPTPGFIGYALYPAGLGLCRYDVTTARLPEGADFPETWRGTDAATRPALLAATAALLRALDHAEAYHRDLNAKNIHLAYVEGAWQAHVLDVDCIRFLAHDAHTVGPRNLARLARSLRKLRDTQGLDVTEPDIAMLQRLAQVTT